MIMRDLAFANLLRHHETWRITHRILQSKSCKPRRIRLLVVSFLVRWTISDSRTGFRLRY